MFTYHLFCKNHKYLPVNQAIRRLTRRYTWKGDIVVMCQGIALKDTVVNIRDCDSNMVDYAVKR